MKLIVVLSLCLFSVLGTPSRKIFLRNLDSRIVNGERAKEGQFPWQVALHIAGEEISWFCGGSIISEEWVLTAGHCVDGASSGRVLAGIIELRDSQAQESFTEDFVLHEAYNPDTLENDIGLVKLTDPLRLQRNIAAVQLSDDPLGENVEVTVSGWGKTSDNGTVSQFLNYVNLWTISNQQCGKQFEDEIFDGMVCANSETDQNQSTCSGDSGGPVVINADSDPVHVAIVSFVSDQGCETGDPSGYVRTAYYRNWIHENTGI